MKRKILWIYCIASLLCPMTTAVAREFRVGVLYWSMNIPGQVAMRKGLEVEIELLTFHPRLRYFGLRYFRHVGLIMKVA